MEEKLRKIIEAGICAPSGDNSQPWHFVIEGNTVHINALTEKDHPILNTGGAGTYLSVGAVIENMTIVALSHGLTATCKYFAGGDNGSAASLTFNEIAPSKHVLHEAVYRRHTNRKPYRKTPLKSEHLTALQQLPGQTGGVTVAFFDNREDIDSIGPNLAAMERIALETRELHYYFFKDILWSRQQALAGEEGFPIDSMEIPPPIRLLFKLIRRWPWANVFNAIGFSKLASKGNASTYSRAGLYAAIMIDEDTSENFIEAGRIAERLWLIAENCGLSVQPVTGIFYLDRKLRLTGPTNLTISHKNLALANTAIENLNKIIRSEGRTCAFFLRIGYDGQPTFIAKRKAPNITIT